MTLFFGLKPTLDHGLVSCQKLEPGYKLKEKFGFKAKTLIDLTQGLFSTKCYSSNQGDFKSSSSCGWGFYWIGCIIRKVWLLLLIFLTTFVFLLTFGTQDSLQKAFSPNTTFPSEWLHWNINIPAIKNHSRQGTAVYENGPDGGFALHSLPTHYDKTGTPAMTIWVFNHAIFDHRS